MNRKGAGESLMIFVFMVLLMIVGGGIFWGVNAFYHQEYDFRSGESVLLLNKVNDCFNNNDFFAPDFDFYVSCHVNKNIIEDGKHMVLVKSSDGSQEVSFGVRDFETQCQLNDKNTNYPKCSESSVVKSGQGFRIITGSNQHSRRIR